MMVLYNVFGSIPTLKSADKSSVGFGVFHFFKKLSLRQEGDGKKEQKYWKYFSSQSGSRDVWAKHEKNYKKFKILSSSIYKF